MEMGNILKCLVIIDSCIWTAEDIWSGNIIVASDELTSSCKAEAREILELIDEDMIIIRQK